MPTLKYEGCALFRQRIVASILTCQPLKIEKIRAKDDAPGLRNFEANFLLLIDKITDGTHVEYNETGTTVRFKPGILQGSSTGSSTGTGKVITHDCGKERSIGWFIEGIIPLAIFSKTPVELELTGITNDATDLSVDILRTVTLPLLQNFGVWGATLEVKRRGARPNGGGRVILKIPPVKTALKPLHVTDEGLVKRVRGVAFSAKVSPATVNRVVDAARAVLNHVLPDVYINTDHYTGHMAGDSPGYSLSLVAETTTGVLLSVERTAQPRLPSAQGSAASQVGGAAQGWATGGPGADAVGAVGAAGAGVPELPEDVGREAAMMLLQEIYQGGVVDRMHQPLVLQLMVLTPEDVSKVRFGALSGQAVQVLRLLREAFGVTFKIRQETSVVQVGGKRGAAGVGVGGAGGGAGERARAKKARRMSDDSAGDSEEDSEEGSEGSEGGDSGDEQGSGTSGSEEDEEDEDSDNEDADEDDEGGLDYYEDSDNQDTGDSDDNDGESDGSSSGGEGQDGRHLSSVPNTSASASTTTLERTTVVLSCYGIGFSNVYRRVT